MELGLINNEYLSLRFQFDQSLVNKIRALENRRWNPDKKWWEIHIAHLPDIMTIFYIHPNEIDKNILDLYQKQWISTTFEVKVCNTYTYLNGTSVPIEKIDEITSFPIMGAEYNPKFADGSWDGRRHLFNKRDHSFPTGLLPKVLHVLKANNISYTLQDNRKGDSPTLKWKSPRVELRNYQKIAIQNALNHKRGIIEMATGSGKTLVAAYITAKLGLPMVFFVHTRDLLYQAKDVFSEMLDTSIGQVGDGKVEIMPITIATIQTVTRALGKKYQKFDEEDEDDLTDIKKNKENIIKMVASAKVVFFDECHHLPADTCYNVAMRTESAYFRFGLSATPYRSDRQDMLIEAALGAKIMQANASVLIDEKFLVPPRILFITVKGNGNDLPKEYQDIYHEWIVTNPKRNQLIADKALEFASNNLTVLILVQHVKHGEKLLKLITDAKFIQGSNSSTKRNKVLKEFKEKKLKILIATTLADEGLDVPSLGAVILAGGGKSETRTLQRVGRALRPSEEKAEAIVVDFLDCVPYLEEHSKNRLEIFKTEPRFKIQIDGDLPFVESRDFLQGKQPGTSRKTKRSTSKKD